MLEVLSTYRLAQIDPTGTLGIANTFARQMKLRFQELVNVVRISVDKNDCFGLKSPDIFQMVPTGAEAFKYARSSAKIQEFMKWLQEQVNAGILTVTQYQQIGESIESAWTNVFITDTYQRGVQRARSEMIKAGYSVPTIAQTGGIEMAMAAPVHADRLGLLFTRTYNDLKGITASMDAQISRILAQGLADGDNPRILAQKIIAVINGDGVDRLGITDTLGRFIPAERRAEILARTEIIRAHHLGTIQEYRNWGIEGVFVQAEFKTSGDNRVCSKCEELAKGSPYTLDQIEKMIPAHPACRCVALPYVLN